MQDFKSLSKNLNVTPNAVREHYRNLIKNNNDLKQHVIFTKHHKYNFDSKLTSILLKSFHHKPKGTSINYLRELHDKQNQINHLNRQLEQEQKLNIASQSVIKSLRGQLHQKRLSYRKHGFIWHLFH